MTTICIMTLRAYLQRASLGGMRVAIPLQKCRGFILRCLLTLSLACFLPLFFVSSSHLREGHIIWLVLRLLIVHEEGHSLGYASILLLLQLPDLFSIRVCSAALALACLGPVVRCTAGDAPVFGDRTPPVAVKNKRCPGRTCP